MKMRPLGSSGIQVSTVALGCWPIAGVTSLDVNPQDSARTLLAALDEGINFFDTAYSYGFNGESERLIGDVTQGCRDSVVIATKGGLHRENGVQRHDARPETLIRQCDESLKRLRTDRVELYYLHAPDPQVSVTESAAAIAGMISAGKVRSAGASNLSLEQLESFHAVCPLTAIQPPYNMLQREIESDLIPWCLERNIAVCVYWPLMKGLLAGKLSRDHQFADGDGRKKYPMFQGDEWHKNQDLLDELKQIACESGHELAAMVIAWTLQQPGITSALCGAKRAWQIKETAHAGRIELDEVTLSRIQRALQRRGMPVTKSPV